MKVVGIDIGERNGCAFSYFGFAAAPLFASSTALFAAFMRWNRQKLNAFVDDQFPHHQRQLGKAYFNTWKDLAPTLQSSRVQAEE
jgi:hypothetical protein